MAVVRTTPVNLPSNQKALMGVKAPAPVVNPNDYAQLTPEQKAIADRIGQQRQTTQGDTLYKAPAPAKPTAPAMPQISPFQAPQYNYMTYDQAKGQAGDRLNPEYAIKLQEALTNVKNQAMGSGFYGQLPTVQYSADTSGQIEAQKQAAIAQLAQSLQDADYQRGEREYDKAFNLWGANNDIAYKNYDIGYGAYRDQVGDSNRLDDIARDEKWKNVDNGWRAREWNRQDTWRNQDNAFRDKEFNEGVRQFNTTLAARNSGGGGGGGRSGKSKTSAYDIKKNYIANTVESRKRPVDAMAQFKHDKASLKKSGLEDWEIAEIENYIIDWGNNESDRNGKRFVPAPLSDYDKWNMRR